VDPAVVAAVLAVTEKSRPGTRTWTVLEQLESVLPAVQLAPAVAVVTVADRILFPVSGSFTVTENVTVTEPPGDRLPVQFRLGLANDTDPPVAEASPL
jgi:hypothetical protein